MKSTVGFPQPILAVGSNDYVNCHFKPTIVKNDSGSTFTFDITYELTSEGLISMIQDGNAKVAIQTECSKTSCRQLYFFEKGFNHKRIEIEKKKIAKEINISIQIIATNDIENFKLAEHNIDYFSGLSVQLRKGDLLAFYEFRVTLNDDEYEKSVMSIFNFIVDETNDITVNAKYDKNRIEIHLSKEFAQLYNNIKGVPDFKRCASEMLVLPVLTEAIDFLRYENEEYEQYRWFGVIKYQLSCNNFDINELEDSVSSVFLANLLLGNIVVDACNHLRAYDNNKPIESEDN